MIPGVKECSRIGAVALSVLAICGAPATAAQLRPGFREAVVASGLSRATAMAFAPDGRIFVCQQGGQLRVIKDGTLLATPFLTVTVNSSGERGLLGVAFDPTFAFNNFVYIYYTATTPNIHNRVSRFTASGDVALPGSEVVLLDLNPLTGATNHNGGALHFGPDGKLYIGVGENATRSNAQTLANLLGKILRINADGSIPADNPFYTTARGVNRAIWALGLRNPFTFAIHPLSGRLLINDVGQSTWEEINEGIAGANYGWPETEGPTNNPSFTGPLYSYGRGNSAFRGCAITGGAFYHGLPAQFPADYLDDYFFADLCSGWINRLDSSTGAVTTFASDIDAPVDLAIGPEGGLYYLARGAGRVVRVSFASQAPVITRNPVNVTVAAGQAATFTVSATGAAPLAYQWQRNGQNIGGATSPAYTLAFASLSDSDAEFRCVVSNASGNAVSDGARLTVIGRGGRPGDIDDRLPISKDLVNPPIREQ
jgi:glucose/arabinose dehydrogenase